MFFTTVHAISWKTTINKAVPKHQAFVTLRNYFETVHFSIVGAVCGTLSKWRQLYFLYISSYVSHPNANRCGHRSNFKRWNLTREFIFFFTYFSNKVLHFLLSLTHNNKMSIQDRFYLNHSRRCHAIVIVRKCSSVHRIAAAAPLLILWLYIKLLRVRSCVMYWYRSSRQRMTTCSKVNWKLCQLPLEGRVMQHVHGSRSSSVPERGQYSQQAFEKVLIARRKIPDLDL